MGKMEQGVWARTRNRKIKETILTVLLVSVAGVLNPQMLIRGVMRELKKPKSKRLVTENAIYNARGRLVKQGLIEYKEGFWLITDKGKHQLRIIEAGKSLVVPRKWDKKWRILIFDIREERKSLRDKVRRTLLSLGFKRLQDSVWIFPYDCEDFVALLKADFRIGKDLLYIIADSVENDLVMRKEFGLG